MLTTSRRALLGAAGASALAVASPALASDGVHRRSTRTNQGEVIILEPLRGRRRRLPLVVYGHGYTGTAFHSLTADGAAGQRKHLYALARNGHRVMVSDLGGQLWGNQQNQRYVLDLIRMHRRMGGSRGKVLMVGASMGGGMSLSFAARFPQLVRGVVAFMPAVDLETLRLIFPVDDAFKGGYSDRVYGLRAGPLAQARHAANRSEDGKRTRIPGLVQVPTLIYGAGLDEFIRPEHLALFRKHLTDAGHRNISLRMQTLARHDDTTIRRIPVSEVRHWVDRQPI